MPRNETDSVTGTIQSIPLELSGDELEVWLATEIQRRREDEQAEIEKQEGEMANSRRQTNEKRLELYRQQKAIIEANISNSHLPVLMKKLFKLIFAREDIRVIDQNLPENRWININDFDNQYGLLTYLPGEVTLTDQFLLEPNALGQSSYDSKKVRISFKFTFDQEGQLEIQMIFITKTLNGLIDNTYQRTERELRVFNDLLANYLITHGSFSMYLFVENLDLKPYDKLKVYKLR